MAANSKAIAASWNDPQVRAERSARHGVVVARKRYRSVRAALVDLQLPLTGHEKFRKELKASGEGKFQGYKFRIDAAA